MSWKPFSAKEEDQILQAIKSAERMCSGEIRVHVDQYCKTDPMFKASNLFEHLGMSDTELRNGVLIYVAIKDRKFCILGDSGINQKVPLNFWESTRDTMEEKFKSGEIVAGIVCGVECAGIQLKQFFPRNADDIDELPDDISYGA